MKLKSGIIVVFSLLTIGANAKSTEPSINVVRKDSSSIYTINYFGSKVGTATLTITDKEGNVLVKRSVPNVKDFSIPVNFASADMGKYLVQVDNGTESKKTTLDYNNDSAPTYAKVWNMGKNRYLFQASHVGKEQITIKIYNEKGDLVHEDKKTISGDFAVLYNVTGMSGTPSFEVTESSGNSVMIPGHPLEIVVKK